MKPLKSLAAASLLVASMAGVACAQGPTYGYPPAQAMQTSYPVAAGSQYAAGSSYPGMVPGRSVAYMADQPTTADAAQAQNGEAEEQEEPEEPKPWRLFHGSWLADNHINVYGWVDMGGTGNFDNPASHFNGILVPNDRNDFQFNQNYLVLEKEVNTEERGWGMGGRVDLLYGSDYFFPQSTGFETHRDGTPRWNSNPRYGLAMPQIYAEMAVGKLDLKVGRFYTIIGYESIMAINNFFYSHSYNLQYAEPFTHTGGLFTWKANDDLSLYAGGVNGQDATDRTVDTFALLTGFAYAPKEKKWALNSGLMTGGTEPTTIPGLFAPRTYFSTYLTYNFDEKWQSVSQWDAGWQQNFNGADNTADFWTVTQYLFYKINDCWKAGMRYDMFVDDQGTRLGGLRPGNPIPFGGHDGTVQAITAGLNWTPNPNFRLRPEVRWDWYSGGGTPVFDDGLRNQQFTAAMDGILMF